MAAGAIETLLKRDTLIVGAGLILLLLLAWAALLLGAGTGMDPLAMSGWLLPDGIAAPPSHWSFAYWLVSFFMWATMMVAMMLPSASPMVLLYARVARRAEANGQMRGASAAVTLFTLGYLSLWLAFSAVAVVAQWALEHAGAMSAMMLIRSPAAAGALLIGAGLYQLTPLKEACLTHCRSPAAFLAAHWRPGLLGAWRMGLVHGAYCTGCCAALMLLLFAGGLMNLFWIAGLAILVAAEKLLPFGGRMRLPLGALLIVAGAALIFVG